MALAPHDLLCVRHLDDLVYPTEQPPWVFAALESAPFVVVRRARVASEMVAVGIRGQARGERCAALLPLHAVTQVITPEQLAPLQEWTTRSYLSRCKALQALITVSSVFAETDLIWGPVGSTGFELASRTPTATPTSDLDLIIRSPQRLLLTTVQTLQNRLATIPVHVDIQVETPFGAFALAEYGREAERLVLRTPDGPKLVQDPWCKSR